MARQPRLHVAGLPHHVLQRGINGQAIFAEAQDYQRFLELLEKQASSLGVAIHAYVLMPNHFHLLVTPSEVPALSLLMQAVSRDYVRQFNQRQVRTGTLWDGRFRATVVQPQRDVLAAMVYIDLNPVRSGLVAAAADYRWSSHGHYAGQRTERWLVVPPDYWHLGNTPFAREAAYANLVQKGLGAALCADLTRAVRHGWVLGDAQFVAELQKQTQRRIQPRPPGRPKKSETTQ